MKFSFQALIFLCGISLCCGSVRAQSNVKNMNPDIGANALIEYQNSSRGNDSQSADRNGFELREVELQFSADVDPYWKFASIFALHQEVEIDPVTFERAAEYVFEPEELFVESLSLPVVTVKLGKFKSAMGKHNQLHTHAFPFISAPLVNQLLLGAEGLNAVGASASVLLPAKWFSELTLQGLSGHGEGLEYYDSPSANDQVYVARFRNLWDLSDSLTFELGLSVAAGQNSFDHETNLFGADATFKWRGGRERALVWSTEAIERRMDYGEVETGKGISSYIQYQMNLRWWLQLRGEYLDVSNQNPDPGVEKVPGHQTQQSFLVGFIPSEFSSIRLQYDYLQDDRTTDEQKIVLQFSYSIGAHPAHAY